MAPVFPFSFPHSLVLSVHFMRDGSSFGAWWLETTLFTPLQFRGPLSWLFRSDLQNNVFFLSKKKQTKKTQLGSFLPILCWFEKGEKHVYKLHFSLQKCCPVFCSSLTHHSLDTLLPSLDLREMSSSHSAVLQLQPQSHRIIFRNLQHHSRVSFCCSPSADCQPCETDCGKTLFQPSSSFLPHSCSL